MENARPDYRPLGVNPPCTLAGIRCESPKSGLRRFAMTLADVLTAVAGLAIAGTGFASMAIILALVMPGTVERARARIANRKGLSFTFGLLGLFALIALAGRLLKAPSPPARLAVLVLILGGLATALLGGVALAGSAPRTGHSGCAICSAASSFSRRPCSFQSWAGSSCCRSLFSSHSGRGSSRSGPERSGPRQRRHPWQAPERRQAWKIAGSF